MKLKVLVGILVFLILVNLATIGSYVYLQAGKDKPTSINFLPGPPVPPNYPDLDFSPEQRRQLKKQLDDFKRETQPIKEKERKLENKTFELLQQNPVPRLEIDSNLHIIANIKLELSRKAIQNLIEAKKILTPKQQELFYDAIIRAKPEMPLPPDKRPRENLIPADSGRE